MSFEITEAFVKQYSSNVFHLSQQKGSRLRGSVRTESQVGKTAFYDRIGKVAAEIRTTRHGDTPQMDTPHDRRKVDLFDYHWGDLVDDQDKIRMLNDPTSMYAQAAAWSLGRSMDERIIKAMGAGVVEGEEGGGPTVYLPDGDTGYRLGANDGTDPSQLNVLTLRRIKRILDENEADEMLTRYIVVNAAMLEALLSETEVTSSDYNTVKALVQGEINSFMGFNFIRTELLPKASDAQFASDPTFSSDPTNVFIKESNGKLQTAAGAGIDSLAKSSARVGYAWASDGILLATGRDITGKIAQRPDKSFATQVYAKMSIGAVRMEEEKVVQFVVSES